MWVRTSVSKLSPLGTSLPSSVANSAAEGDYFALEVSKSVPQRLNRLLKNSVLYQGTTLVGP